MQTEKFWLYRDVYFLRVKRKILNFTVILFSPIFKLQMENVRIP